MTRLLDHLAELAGQRDRDALDDAVLALIDELIGPQHLAVHRPVGHRDEPQWLSRPFGGQAPKRGAAHRSRGRGITDLSTLQPLDALPHHKVCWQSGEPVKVSEAPAHWLHPLLTDHEVVGVMEIWTATPMTPEQQHTLQSILKFYKHLRSLLDENERDPLTGLLNRKSFDESFVRAAMHIGASDEPDSGFSAERRHAWPQVRYWLGMVDIDHFKRVNDQYGHLIGDEVLLLLGQVLRNTFRQDELLYRFGGEEFVVLVRCDSAASAHNVFERLRRNVAQFDFPQAGHLTVSVGFTELQASDTPSAAFERADQAVYLAKQQGRDRCVDFDALVADGTLAEPVNTGMVEFF